MRVFFNKRGDFAGFSDHMPNWPGAVLIACSVLNFFIWCIFCPVFTLAWWDAKDRWGVLYKKNWIPYLIINILWCILWYWVIFGNALEPDDTIFSQTPYEQWNFNEHQIRPTK